MRFPRLTLTAAAITFFALPAELAWSRSAADQALYEKAVRACNGPQYPNGARPIINYSGGWFRCQEPRASHR